MNRIGREALYNRRLMFGKSFRSGWALASALLGAGLALILPSEPPSVRNAPPEPGLGAKLAPAVDTHQNLESNGCGAEIERLLAIPPSPGAVVNGGEARAVLLARAKAEPVLFERAPEPAGELSTLAKQLRRELFTSAAPFMLVNIPLSSPIEGKFLSPDLTGFSVGMSLASSISRCSLAMFHAAV